MSGVCRLPVMVLLCAIPATAGLPAFASDVASDATPAQQQPSQDSAHESSQPKDEVKTQGTPNLCEALGAAATANELPVDFFTRLIWQESRFKPDAVSAKGAQGIAQFMPATAHENGLDNPFNPLEAITKSGALLRGLRHEFGNLGLAAAAYNAGPGRVHDWLGGRRTLPRETRAYVRVVTGRSADEWAIGNPTAPLERPTVNVPCDLPVAALGEAKLEAPPSKAETIKPWGVEIVGGTTKASALARYRDWWQPKYESLVAGRETNVVIRGVIGQAGAARVRIGDDTRAGAEKLCASLKAAGAYCDVMRN